MGIDDYAQALVECNAALLKERERNVELTRLLRRVARELNYCPYCLSALPKAVTCPLHIALGGRDHGLAWCPYCRSNSKQDCKPDCPRAYFDKKRAAKAAKKARNNG